MLKLLFGAGNFGEIWSACGQREIQHRERKMNKYTIIAHRSGRTVCCGSTAGIVVSNPAEGMNVLLLCVL